MRIFNESVSQKALKAKTIRMPYFVVDIIKNGNILLKKKQRRYLEYALKLAIETINHQQNVY